MKQCFRLKTVLNDVCKYRRNSDDDNVTSWAVIVSVNFFTVRITVLTLAISLQEEVRSIIQTQFFYSYLPLINSSHENMK
jgi:hypothetical protein